MEKNLEIWLTQRAEPTPHDDNGKRRPMRTGLMAEYFSKQGHQVTWWTGDFDHYGRRQRRFGSVRKPVTSGFDIQYLAASGYRKSMSLERLRYDTRIGLEFTRLAPTMRLPDVILASMPSVDLALETVKFGNRHDVPVAVDIRDLHPDIFFDLVPKALRPALYLGTRKMHRKVQALCKGADAIWGNTDSFVSWGCDAAGRSRGPFDQTFPIAYRKTDVPQCELDELAASWNRQGLFQPNTMNVVFFGTMSPSFDFEKVFDAARRLQEEGGAQRFYFFGAGALEEKVRSHCAVCHNSHYMGWAGPTELQLAMALSDFGLAPYIPVRNYMQNMPNKPTEYMSAGLGVALGLPSGVLKDFLDREKCGFSYSSGSQLASKLQSLANNPEELKFVKQAARGAFERYFSYENLSDNMLKALTNLVSGHNSRKLQTS